MLWSPNSLEVDKELSEFNKTNYGLLKKFSY